MDAELHLETPWRPSYDSSKFENFVALLKHFRLQVQRQALDLVILSRMVPELRLETPWSRSYDPSKF